MKKPKLVVGHLMNDQLLVKSVTTPKHIDWLKWLETEELVEFFGEFLKLMTQISEGKKDVATLSTFLADWRETALINSEPEVLRILLRRNRNWTLGVENRGHKLSRRSGCEMNRQS